MVLAKLPRGLYALTDYLNFKGEGTLSAESYGDTRWGLLQVLLGMDDEADLIKSFVSSAKIVLTQRVAASPQKQKEKGWLPGWLHRVEGYEKIEL